MSSLKLLRLDQVKEKTGLGKSSIYAQIKIQKFLASVKAINNSVGWVASEMDSRSRERNATQNCSIGGSINQQLLLSVPEIEILLTVTLAQLRPSTLLRSATVPVEWSDGFVIKLFRLFWLICYLHEIAQQEETP